MRSAISVMFMCTTTISGLAQAPLDTLFVQESITNSIAVFTAGLGKESALYNGRAYEEPEQTNDDHPFFKSYDWITGSVVYDGQEFTGISLLYDITSHQVITESLQGHMLSLIPEKLHSFRIGDHRFQKISFDSTLRLPDNSFLESLYDGRTSIFVYHQKVRSTRLEDQVEEIYYTYRSRYFIRKEHQLLPVKGRSSILKAFEDDGAIKKFVRKNGLKFSKSVGNDLVVLARHYDSTREAR